MTVTDEEWLTAQEAADLVGVNPRTLQGRARDRACTSLTAYRREGSKRHWYKRAEVVATFAYRPVRT